MPPGRTLPPVLFEQQSILNKTIGQSHHLVMAHQYVVADQRVFGNSMDPHEMEARYVASPAGVATGAVAGGGGGGGGATAVANQNMTRQADITTGTGSTNNGPTSTARRAAPTTSTTAATARSGAGSMLRNQDEYSPRQIARGPGSGTINMSPPPGDEANAPDDNNNYTVQQKYHLSKPSYETELPNDDQQQQQQQQQNAVAGGARQEADLTMQRRRSHRQYLRDQSDPQSRTHSPHSPRLQAQQQDPTPQQVQQPLPTTQAPQSQTKAQPPVAATAAAGSASIHGSTGHHHHRGRQSIGEWRFVKTVGQGSMGQVKLAENQRTGALCAVKIVPRGGGKKDESKDIRTLREAAIGSLLHHPNVCKLYEVHAMPNHFYLLFEYVSGGQMLDYIIAHGSLKEKHARKFARSIASALDYCHRNSIVHRDLKIENILISSDGGIKIIDFGLSNLYNRRSLLKTFCGSLYFAAPELLSAKPYIGPEVDVWSFGIVLYVLVCGKVPFDDESMPALHEMIKRGKVEYPAWLSPECCDILSRMLVVDPTQRASLAEVMNHPWMKRGYDTPIESDVPPRVPIRDPLNPEVLDKIAEFDIFGKRADIEAELRSILDSPDYIRACQHWYSLHQPQTRGHQRSASAHFPSSSHSQSHRHFSLDFSLRRSSSVKHDLPDAVNAYHPLLSMYYLVQEKINRQMARSARQQQQQSLTNNPFNDRQSMDSELVHRPSKVITRQKPLSHSGSVSVSSPLPNSPGTATTNYNARNTSGISPLQPINNNNYNNNASTNGYKPGHQHHASEPVNKGIGTLLRRLSSRRKSTAAVQPPGYHPPSVSMNNSPNPAVGVAEGGGAGGHHRAKSVSVAATHRASSINDPTRRRYMDQGAASAVVGSGNASPAMVSTKNGGITGGDVPQSEMQNMSLTSRTRSWGHAKAGSIDRGRDASDQLSIQYPKQVFLKGFFSVQSTSTKPLPYVRSDVIRVLNELNIPFREVKGGFTCVYRASLEPGANETQQQTFAKRRISFGSGMFRRKSILEDSDATGGTGSTESLDSDNRGVGGSDMLGHDTATEGGDDVRTPVRFKVYIVRIPLLGLHGVQFKKLTGNSWQYKNLATKILGELKL